MESLLMGGDDSSSGESDDEVPIGATTAASAVTVAVQHQVPPDSVLPTQSPSIPTPDPAGTTTPASTPTSVKVPSPSPPAAPSASSTTNSNSQKSSQADQMARLKSLYSISKSTASSNVSSGAGNSGSGTSTASKISQPPPQQLQQKQQPATQQHKTKVDQQSQPSQHSNQNQRQQQPRTQPQQEIQPTSRSQPQQRQQQAQQFSQSSTQRAQYNQQQQTHHQRQTSQPTQHHQKQQQQQIHRPHISRRGNVHQSHSPSSQSQQHHQAADPFAPTPLSQIKQSNEQHRRTHHQQQVLQRQPTQPSTRMPQLSVGGSSSSGSSRERDIKKQKEKFLMFTRVLIKYLEQKDKRMHQQAKIIIKDCAERNKRQEPGYESVTESMKRRLKELVGDHYWKKANDYLIHFIDQKRRQHAAATSSGGSSGGLSRSSGSGVSSSSHQQQQLRQQQQQHLEQQRRDRQKQQEDRERERHRQHTEQQRLKTEQQSGTAVVQQGVAASSPSDIDLHQDIQDKREEITIQTTKVASGLKSKSKSAPRSTAASTTSLNATTTITAATKSKGGTKKQVRRKSTSGDSSITSSRKGGTGGSNRAATVPVPVKRIVVEEPPREYNELMELIDHAMDYEWPAIGQLLGDKKSDLKLTEEEHLLLYGDLPESSMLAKRKNKKISEKTPLEQGICQKIEEQDDQTNCREVGVRPGWGRSNVLSARAAWARVRLKELTIREQAASNPFPVVADGLLTLSTSTDMSMQDIQKSTAPAAIPTVDASSATKPEIEGSWINEEAAEQDLALTILSGGCQIYLKGVLQKTIQCARQRQNLDGIRLWHQQYTFNKGTSATSFNTNSSLTVSKENKNKNDDKLKKPPLSLRLGCDVSRQVAQSQGNAAMTVKRMEEALERQTGIPLRARELHIDTLQEATSMSDLSWRPLLKEGAEKADCQAKRLFEVFGGKEAKSPPLGRVPKKAKLQVEDLLMGSELSIDGPYHKAYTVSSFISF